MGVLEPEDLYATQHSLGDAPVPAVVLRLAGDGPVELVWRNELGGLTFRLGDTFVKWNPRRTGVDLERSVGDTWRARRPEAIRAIATGLRAIHALPLDDVPARWTAESWVGRTPPRADRRRTLTLRLALLLTACEASERGRSGA